MEDFFSDLFFKNHPAKFFLQDPRGKSLLRVTQGAGTASHRRNSLGKFCTRSTGRNSRGMYQYQCTIKKIINYKRKHISNRMCHSGPAIGGEDLHFRTIPSFPSWSGDSGESQKL